MQGFLNLNKPKGLTSHDCVAKLRRSLRLKRIGHAGTLDPAATGVLPIALGRATRLLQFLPSGKAYRATIRLGISTTTDDLEGEVQSTQPASHLVLTTVEAALQQFQGTIQQIPPNYSAVQVDGKRLYDLARAGKPIAAAPRQVEIVRLEVLDWRPGEFPELDLEVVCGAGTYIRAIARDLGAVLQTGGTLATLLRTESSGFSLANSLTLEELASQAAAAIFQPIPPDAPLTHLPVITLSDDLARRWRQGQRISQTALDIDADLNIAHPYVRVYDSATVFLGIGQTVETPDSNLLIPTMVFEPIA